MEEIFKIKTEEKALEFIANKMYKQWIEENPGLEEDILKLSSEIIMFNVKWGAKIN